MLFMEKLKIPVSNSNNIRPPAHEGDVGHDLVAAQPPFFCGKPLDETKEYFSLLRYIEYETFVAAKYAEGTYSLVYPRSSITKDTNLILGNCVGVIDNGYRDSIKVRFRYIPQPEDYELIDGKIFIRVNRERIYKQGDKIAQLVFMKSQPVELIKGSVANDTSRGLGGFGSTGR